MITVWHDGLIRPGAKWQEEIEGALARARIAVLQPDTACYGTELIAALLRYPQSSDPG